MRRVHLLAVVVLVAAVLAVPTSSAVAAAGHYERPAQARLDLMHVTWSSPWRHDKVVSTYIEGWERFRRPRIGVQWYPRIKVSRPCYPPHCIATKPAALPDSGGNGVFAYDAATHRESVTWQYGPGFVARHFSYKGNGSNVADPWYEPWTWCWSCAWHDLWSSIIAPCANGAVTLTGLKGASVVAQKLLDEGAAFMRLVGRASGPEGWGAVALQGCIFGIVFHKASAGVSP
jgi:hypothetical protein